MGIESKIENSVLLTDIFGRWPSFHDAEVLSITLDRGEARIFNPTLRVAVHVYEMTPEIDNRNRYVLKHHVVVTFHFSRVIQISLQDFNHQNVLSHLSIVDLSDRQLEHIRFEVTFEGTFGVTANFQCGSIAIESVEPYESDLHPRQ
jgi:hypothetical protein